MSSETSSTHKDKKEKKKKSIIPTLKEIRTRKWKEGDKLKLFGYCRVSTTQQVEEGASLDAQEKNIMDYCDRKGYELIRVFKEEGVMGSKELVDRPEMNCLLHLLRKGDAHGIIVHRRDRLCRSVKIYVNFMEYCQQNGYIYLSIVPELDTSTQIGKLMGLMLAGLAEMEREIIRERTMETLAFKKANEQVTGTCPYGKRRAVIDGKITNQLEDDPYEQENITIARELRDTLVPAISLGGKPRRMPYRDIVKKMQEMGRKNRTGKDQWYTASVRAMVLGEDRKLGRRKKKEEDI